jgi:hypothetical protein
MDAAALSWVNMSDKIPPPEMQAIEAAIAKMQYKRQSIRRIRLVKKIMLVEFELATLRKELEILDEELARLK